MHIDTAGTYTLQYTATDSCGNETIEERTVEVVSLRTVLYTDGTFIINEKSTDIDANIALHGAATNVYDPLDATHRYVFMNQYGRPWNGQATNVTRVEIGSKIKPVRTEFWFENFNNCTSMDFSLLDTSDVTSMAYMFAECNALTSLDVSNFDTSNVTDMAYMFEECNVLTSLDVSNFNTSNVTNMERMFDGCNALTTLDVSNFDTSNVTNMALMFNNCNAIESLDLLNFNTSKVTDMSNMFSRCSVLQSLDLSSFDTSIVTTMTYMMAYCPALKTADLSSFNTSQVRDMSGMFSGDSAMQTIYASENYVVAQVTSDIRMFNGMSTNLIGGAGTVWNAYRINKTYAHIDGGTADPGYFTAKP